MMKRLINIIALTTLMIGFFLLIKPFAKDYQIKKDTQQAIDRFNERVEIKKADFVIELENCLKSEENVSLSDYGIYTADDIDRVYIPDLMFDLRLRVSDETRAKLPEMPFSNIYNSMYDYNVSIYENKQSELKDAFSYTTNDFELESYGLTDDIIGFITIDAMNIKLPMYIGSSEDHMSHGATIMNQTSMPIGGNNTNCVVAAHRSLGFFLNIENLSEGDTIIINNLWGEMGYTVIKTAVISPYDIDKIKIYPERELLTLITCHPYGINNDRYVVYCARNDDVIPNHIKIVTAQLHVSQQTDNEIMFNSEGDSITGHSYKDVPDSTDRSFDITELPLGNEFVSSSKSIRSEIILRVIGIIMTGVFIFIFLVMRTGDLIRFIKERKNPKTNLQ